MPRDRCSPSTWPKMGYCKSVHYMLGSHAHTKHLLFGILDRMPPQDGGTLLRSVAANKRGPLPVRAGRGDLNWGVDAQYLWGRILSTYDISPGIYIGAQK